MNEIDLKELYPEFDYKLSEMEDELEFEMFDGKIGDFWSKLMDLQIMHDAIDDLI